MTKTFKKKIDGKVLGLSVASLLIVGSAGGYGVYKYDEAMDKLHNEKELRMEVEKYNNKLNGKVDDLQIQLKGKDETIKNKNETEQRLRRQREERDNKIEDLNDTLHNKDEKIEQLKKDLQAKKEREERERQQAKLLAESKVNKQESSKSKETGRSDKNPVRSANDSNTESSVSGKTLTMKTTAYTAYCAGCSGTTKTGINLRSNPSQKMIAADPSVIPLGTKVHVEGYGTATVGDVGGGINNLELDLYMPTESQANAWGVRTVTVTILD